MITKEFLLKLTFFDIETVGVYETFEELQRVNPRLATLWEKKCKDLREDKKVLDPADHLWEYAPLYAEFCRIVCVSIGAINSLGERRIVSFKGDEEQILLDTNRIFDNAIRKGMRLCGHSIKNFDIPVLGKRMLKYKIKPSEIINLWNKKPWENTSLDLGEIFCFGAWGRNSSSLDLIACHLGVESPKKEMNGAHVHEAFYQGKIDEIAEYCERDVSALIDIFEKMSKCV